MDVYKYGCIRGIYDHPGLDMQMHLDYVKVGKMKNGKIIIKSWQKHQDDGEILKVGIMSSFVKID